MYIIDIVFCDRYSFYYTTEDWYHITDMNAHRC